MLSGESAALGGSTEDNSKHAAACDIKHGVTGHKGRAERE